MDDLFLAIRQAVRDLRNAELDNLKDGTLLCLRGQATHEAIEIRSELYDRREDRLHGLYDLLSEALPAGIAAGFSGEWVVARVHALVESANKAAYWDQTYADDPDDRTVAWVHFEDLFDKVGADLYPFESMAAAAAGLAEARLPLKENWLPASEAVTFAITQGYDITLPWITKRKHKMRTRSPEPGSKHQLEVEMNSLGALLFATCTRNADNADEPDEAGRMRIEARKQAEQARKRRSLN